ncbi:Very-long-chain 3-oxoacyl-coa reductase [Thalictrum thalictroides]|uniref:Very-long-chain 3-oxoacyl-coa reductase n=1 Tax=Thalictrum thalictroides TaxID=46969 RepID=A0A7J6X8G3_THATH|nr:Very-long-chain 3-oxoacyl-coa reductase [Thalictrum thalictroides]
MELQSILFGLTAFIGFITLSKTIVTFLRWVWIAFLRPSKNLTDYGTWALVTGSTDGIGKAIAFELASKGLNLVLVGRDLLKLEHTSNALCEAYGSTVQIKYIVIDFVKAKGVEIVKKIEEEISGLDVGLLINNAGMANSYAEYFHLIDTQVVESIVRVNIEAATWVTKAVLPVMLKKKKGAIVNIGSASGFIPLPLSTVYSATKSYIEMFSRSISLEYKHTGIHVQCQAPFIVATKMTSIRRSSFFIPSAEMYSKASLRQIGYENICTPYWTHYIFWCILDALPEALRDRFVLRHYLTLREKGLLKMSMKNKKNP